MEDPVTSDERQAVAKVCMIKLSLDPMPALVDDMKNTAGSAYDAHPDRLYLVGRDGRIVYQGGPGPRGFRPDELAEAIETELKE